MMEDFWDQSDKIFLRTKWWNIFGTKMMNYFLDQNNGIVLGPKWRNIFEKIKNDEIFLDQSNEIYCTKVMKYF